MAESELEQRAINVIRGLSMDGPRAANSGHQGTGMALAPLAHVLWTRVMNYNAAEPHWPDRDRFVLSAGHVSILQYAMLYLTGYGLTLDDLRDFRQWGSLTPGHPEVHHTEGIEVTTGPLGQGFANGVGLGVTERWLRAKFGSDICDHYTYVICGDGDLAEGISHEAASLAGHLGLGRLIYVYDDNHVSIDGPTELSLSDDAPGRFASYGWHVDDIGEAANDTDALEAALLRAKDVEDAPSMIVLRSHIAYPSPDHTDDPATHGLAMDEAAIARTKEAMGLPPDETFHVPDDVLEMYREAGRRGHGRWEASAKALAGWSGDRAALDACLAGGGVAGWADALPSYSVGEQVATRNASGACIQAIAESVPGLVAGGADLTGNTGTKMEGDSILDSPDGRQIHFGIREHGMGGIMNGMALHGGLLPVGGTFLVFSDYMRGAVRLAALSKAKVVFSWTHDSVGVGEDGPTHQPIEHVSSLRAMPGLRVMRPADAVETVEAWKLIVDNDGPTALILTRQNVPVLEGTGEGLTKGGYVVVDPDGDPDLVLIGTGSEVSVCVEAAMALAADGVNVRVVSMPCTDLFDEQDDAYQSSVLLEGVPRLSVEAGTTWGWHRYADDAVGIDRFGASAPGDVVMVKLGIEPDNVAKRARVLLSA